MSVKPNAEYTKFFNQNPELVAAINASDETIESVIETMREDRNSQGMKWGRGLAGAIGTFVVAKIALPFWPVALVAGAAYGVAALVKPVETKQVVDAVTTNSHFKQATNTFNNVVMQVFQPNKLRAQNNVKQRFQNTLSM